MEKLQTGHVYDVPDNQRGTSPHIYSALCQPSENEKNHGSVPGEYHYIYSPSMTVNKSYRSCVLQRSRLVVLSVVIGIVIGVLLTVTGFLAFSSKQENDTIKIEKFESPSGNKSFATPEGYQFRMIRCEIGNSAFIQQFITFSVRACSDAYIVLTSEYEDTGPLIEIALGTNGNMRSGIRTEKLGRNIVSFRRSLLNCRIYSQFWISWKRQYIAVGLGSKENENQIISMRDDRSLTIVNIGISTRWATTGDWLFRKP